MDQQIWLNIRNGDANAMKTLYQESYQELFAYGFRLIADKEKVKDCLHEIFCELWQRRDRMSDVVNVNAYLKACVRNKLLKQLKQDQKTEQIDDQDLDYFAENSYEQLLIAAETDEDLKVKIWQALDKLTPTQREIIKLKYFDGLSYEAISLMLKLKPRTVYNHVYGAISTLKDGFKS